jgi:hypothetical protein
VVHRFHTGQTVLFSSRTPGSSGSLFKIVRPMPVDRDDRLRYQIKSATEAFSRIVEEHELTLS